LPIGPGALAEEAIRVSAAAATEPEGPTEAVDARVVGFLDLNVRQSDKHEKDTANGPSCQSVEHRLAKLSRVRLSLKDCLLFDVLFAFLL